MKTKDGQKCPTLFGAGIVLHLFQLFCAAFSWILSCSLEWKKKKSTKTRKKPQEKAWRIKKRWKRKKNMLRNKEG